MKKLNVALVCMPWNYFYNPSIQLGSLKSFVKKRLPEVNVDILNFHLKVGKYFPEIFKKISDEAILFLESFYAKLLYSKLELFYDYRRFNKIFKNEEDMKSFIRELENYQEKIFEEVGWYKYDIVGFTTSMAQLTSSLYLIKKLKKKYPKIKVIIGGANATDVKGKSLMECFKEIDIAVSGEGELNFYNILKSKLEGNENYKKLPGIIYRENEKVISNPGFNQLEDLNELEIPDYSDYFRDLSELKIDINNVAFPLEFSRGCFYGKCKFCQINTHSSGYRTKKINHFIEEIKLLEDIYSVNKFILCDANFRENDLKKILEKIIEYNKNHLFSNIKILWMLSNSNLHPSTTKLLADCDIEEIFVGVEALSDTILKKMKKPTSLINNIQIIKMLELYIKSPIYYIIYDYPNVTELEITNTVKNMKKIEHLPPPRLVKLVLLIGSEIYNRSNEIKIIGNEYNYKYLFPRDILKNLNLPRKEFKNKNNVDWKPVIKTVEEWTQKYSSLKKISNFPILYHFKKNDKIIVVRRTLKGKVVYKLNENESKIYEFCDVARSWEKLKEEFRNPDEEKIRKIVNKLKEKKLMFESDGKVLALSLDLKKYQKYRV